MTRRVYWNSVTPDCFFFVHFYCCPSIIFLRTKLHYRLTQSNGELSLLTLFRPPPTRLISHKKRTGIVPERARGWSFSPGNERFIIFCSRGLKKGKKSFNDSFIIGVCFEIRAVRLGDKSERVVLIMYLCMVVFVAYFFFCSYYKLGHVSDCRNGVEWKKNTIRSCRK